LMQRLTGRDILACSQCGKGRLQLVAVLNPSNQPWPTGPPWSCRTPTTIQAGLVTLPR